MRYIIIEDFNQTINLVTNEEGKVFVSEDLEEANLIAKECQNGLVFPLTNLNLKQTDDQTKFIVDHV